MFEIIIFLLNYFFILFSTLGYGLMILSLTNNQKVFNNFGYVGLAGIFFLIIYSYASNLIIAHSMVHNLFFISFGIVFFIFYDYKKKKKEILFTSIIFFVLFIGIILFKTHDDFPYYHFPYSYYLTQNPAYIGIGQLNHGFRTPSSIFYLNSIFYLPFIKFKLFHLSSVLVMGFANIIFLNKIYDSIKIKKINYITFFSLLSFIFINIFFYRIAEHGTDRSAQILILILLIEILIFLGIKKNFSSQLSKLYVIIALVISFKAFYILYLLFFIPVVVVIYNEYEFKNTISVIVKNNFFYFFLFLLILVLTTNFLNTGCLLYPVSLTCFDNFSWSISLTQVNNMNNWYELWSKAGATPNYRVDEPLNYIKNFNWVSNWINYYFFNKVSDFLLGLLFLIIIVYLTFYSKAIKLKNVDQKLIAIYIILFILLLEWFYNHPSLRYGGYCLIASIFFLLISLRLQKNFLNLKTFKKKVLILIVITLIVFFSRNVFRIKNEIEKYNLKFLNIFSFEINEKHFRIQKRIEKKIENYNNCILNKSSCDITSDLQVKKLINKYVFYKK